MKFFTVIVTANVCGRIRGGARKTVGSSFGLIRVVRALRAGKFFETTAVLGDCSFHRRPALSPRRNASEDGRQGGGEQNRDRAEEVRDVGKEERPGHVAFIQLSPGSPR